MGGIRTIGCVGVGRFNPYENGNRTKLYDLWCGMLGRCYSAKVHARQPLYAQCSASEKFLNFQEFSEWCVTQQGFNLKGWCLDKDLLLAGNTVYHEDLCVFLPQDVNKLISFDKGKVSGRLLPPGVSKMKRDTHKPYKVTVSLDGENVHVGCFETVGIAADAYRTAKLHVIKMKADQHRDLLDARAYDALLNFKI